LALTNNSTSAPLKSIIHATTGSWGTATGLFRDELTNNIVLLSCGHVLRSDASGYIKESMDQVKVKLQTGMQPLGKVINLNLSNYIDAAVVELVDSKLERLFSGVESTRPVTDQDEIRQQKVIIKTVGGDRRGTIYLINRNCKMTDKNQEYFMYGLIMIRNDPEFGIPSSQQQTIPGDSGSLVIDNSGNAIGIHIGSFVANDVAQYVAICLQDIMQLFHLKPIQ
jgi:hypothetical protein